MVSEKEVTSKAGMVKPTRDWRDDYVCCAHVMALEHPASTDGVRHSGFVIWCESCWNKWVEAGCPDRPTEMACFKGALE